MRILLIGILVGCTTIIVVLNTTPIAVIELPTQGGGSFIPSVFGSAAAATIGAIAIVVACWIAPKMAFRSRLARHLRPGEILVMIQATEGLKRALADVSPSVLMPLIASVDGIRFFGARGATRWVPASDVLVYRVNPKGYQGRTPTIEMSFREGSESREIDFVVARPGFEILAEKRLAALEETQRRLQALASGVGSDDR